MKLSSGGIRVVENWGVDGGTGGGVYSLVKAGLVARSGIDGKTNEDAREDGLLSSVVAVAAKYLPLESRHAGFASIANAVLAMRQNMKQRVRQ
jgi:hypothetical protein